jgi:hypothetical protein
MQQLTKWTICILLLGLCQLAFTQEDNGDEPKKSKKSGPKAYQDVITNDAETDEGLFTVHKVDSKYFFELPFDLLEEEILIVSRIAGHVKGLNFGGAGMKSRPQQVIRWQRLDNKVLLRSVSYNSVADFDDPVYQSLRNNNFEPVIQTFDIAAFNPDSTGLVFDVTAFFTTDVDMIGALRPDERKRFGVKSLDKSRSFVSWMKSFPENTEVRHVLTYNGGEDLPANSITGTLSIEMNQSFIKLPEEPMQPRLYDARVGYFSIKQTNYSLDAQRAEDRRYITRWRLEPTDWDAWKRGELVDPVKPIVYYIDPGTPEKWRPFIMQGVNDWQSAFEKAGFKNAIMAKIPPSPEEDPDWHPEDVRYSVIRYITTDIQNAQGPHVHDPRTGEILESDILWYHNVMNLLRNWFMMQTAAVNPEARSVKFDDEVMGELIRFVAAHEVGHTLGLPHNMGSSAAYPVDSLRAPGFVQRMGVAPSIMDYARFNYVAQPGDEGVGLHPKIGPYDDWAIIYGYRPIPEASSTEEERLILNKWIKERAGNPYYRYGQQSRNTADPSAQTEDVGSDPIEASNLGLANLKRILPNLPEWSAQEGMPFEDLEELYSNVIGQLGRYARHVGTNVGGVFEYRKTSDEEGAVFIPLDRERQAAAVKWLNTNVFATPKWLLNQDILSRIESNSATERIGNLQKQSIDRIFDIERLKRMMETATRDQNNYTILSLFEDTRRGGIFTDLYTPQASDIFQRNLQRTYLEKLVELMKSTENGVPMTEIPAVARYELTQLQSDLNNALSSNKRLNTAQRIHYQDIVARIEAAMEVD